MQNLYPLFVGDRILTKELLWAVRDRSFMHLDLEYREYGDGILKGCGVRVENGRIIVEPGMIKYGGFIYLMPESESVEYGSSKQQTILKMRLGKDSSSVDYTCYCMELALENEDTLEVGEFEVCRYKLQRGAVLRAEHENFEDMETEYDTLNYIHASWGGLRGKAMAPMVTRRFAMEILETEGCKAEDIMFAYFCLSQPGTVPMDILTDYLDRKNGKGKWDIASNQIVFGGMRTALKGIKGVGTGRCGESGGRRRIIVD